MGSSSRLTMSMCTALQQNNSDSTTAQTAKATACKGNVSEMIELSESTVKFLELCNCLKTTPYMIINGDCWSVFSCD